MRVSKNTYSGTKVTVNRSHLKDVYGYEVSEEDIESAELFDRVVLSPKEDLSGVGFWDVFLCRKHKWLDYELVNSTKSFTLKGKDIKTVIDNGLSYGVINRHYIDYKDNLYYVQYDGVIEDDKIYEMVYDSLSLDA